MHELSVLSQTERKQKSKHGCRDGICAHATQCVTVEDLKNRARNSARSLRRNKYELLPVLGNSSELVTVALLLALTFGGLDADLLVVLLESGKILTGLRELALFHTLTDVPVNESALGVHKVELVVDTGEDLSDGRGVANHAHGAHNLREITARNNSWWLVVDAALESSRAPVNELDGTLGLDGRDGGVDVLWHDITAVHEAASHVLAVTWVALHVHSSRLEHRHSDLRDGQLLVVGLLR